MAVPKSRFNFQIRDTSHEAVLRRLERHVRAEIIYSELDNPEERLEAAMQRLDRALNPAAKWVCLD